MSEARSEACHEKAEGAELNTMDAHFRANTSSPEISSFGLFAGCLKKSHQKYRQRYCAYTGSVLIVRLFT